MLYFRDDPAGASENFEWALEIWRRELGETHPNVLSMLNNLGRPGARWAIWAARRKRYARRWRSDARRSATIIPTWRRA